MNADKVPTDEELKKADQNLEAATFRFLLMRGIPADARKEPKNLVEPINEKQIFDEWKKSMNINAPIRICGLCGRRDIMTTEYVNKNTPYEYKIVPASSLPNCFKADKDKLPPKNSAIYKAKHLVEIGDHIFKLVKEGIEGDQVTICNICQPALEYANNKSKPPQQTVAYYDCGRIPEELRKFPLNVVERMAISIALVISPVYHINAPTVDFIKGHAYGMKLEYSDIAASIVNKLPRSDLHCRLQLVIYGTEALQEAAARLARRTFLKIRVSRIFLWLNWLKEIGHPFYKDIELKSMDQACKELQHSIDEITSIKNTVRAESGKVQKLAERTRANVEDDKNCLNQNLKGEFIRNVLLCDNIDKNEPFQTIIQKVKTTLKIDDDDNHDENENDPIRNKHRGKVVKTLKNELFNEYEENHLLLGQAFAHVLPFPPTKDVWKGTIVPEKITRTWCQFHDHRFAREMDFLYLLYNQSQRAARNKQVCFKIDKGDEQAKKFIDLCNDDNFKTNLKYATKHPTSKQAINIKKIVQPLIKLIDRKIKWSKKKRGDILGKCYAMMHFFNIATHFITISPAAVHNALAIRLAYTNEANEKFNLPDIVLRSRLIKNNPSVATNIFYRLIRKFFAIIVGLPLEHFTGKKANIERLLQKNKKKYTGAYGFIKAALGIIEEQTSGNLHYHGILFGAWDFDVIQQHIHKPNVAKIFTELIDSHITCEIPQDIKEKHQQKKKQKDASDLKEKDDLEEINDFEEKDESDLKEKHSTKEKTRIFASEPYPHFEEIKKYAATVAICLQCHKKHTYTCWKNNSQHCRMGIPQPQADESYFTQVVFDPNTKKPIGEQIEEFKQFTYEGNPFEPVDERNIVFGYARKDEIERLMTPYNTISTVCLCCNTSMQVLVAPAEAKTAMFYICKYVSKNPFEIKRVIPLLFQADQQLHTFGSKAVDAGSKKRNAKYLLQKLCHRNAKLMEVSPQQVAANVMGEKSEFISHQFQFAFIWSILEQYRKNLKNKCNFNVKNVENVQNKSDECDESDECEEENDENVDLLVLDTEAENGKATAYCQHEKYLNRGKQLQNLCLYLYTGIIGKQSIAQANKKNSSKTTKVGRPPNKTFPFELDSNLAKLMMQIIMSVPCIPRIAGKNPPPYPGARPNKQTYPPPYSNKEFDKIYRRWARKAQLFVEFYTLMFIPLNKYGFPFPQTVGNESINILPWQDKSFDSWDNFWKVFGSWNVPTGNNPTTKLYKRSMWQIFKNMVENLRQGNGDRKLLRDWRNQCSDKRPTIVPEDPNKRSNRNYNNNAEQNDCLAIEEAYRAKNDIAGPGEKPTSLQNMHKYLNKQIENLEKIETYKSNIRMEKQNFQHFSFDLCQKIENKLKTNEKELKIDDDEDDDDDDDITFDDNTKVCYFSFLN